MNAQETANYIRGAVDASPHGIAIICTKDASGSTSISVAYYYGKLVFAGGGSLESLASAQTVQAFPLDFSLKHGADASAKADLFMTELQKNVEGGMEGHQAVQRAMEKLNPNFGVTVQTILQHFESLYKPGQSEQESPFAKQYNELMRSWGDKFTKDQAGHDQFTQAHDYLVGKLTELAKEFGNLPVDHILQKSVFIDKLNAVVQDLFNHHGDATRSLAQAIVETDYLKGKPDVPPAWAAGFAPVTTIQGLITAVLLNMPGMPGVLDEAQENSRLVYDPVHDTWTTLPDADLPPMVEEPDTEKAPPGGGVKADDYRPYAPGARRGDPGVKADDYAGSLADASMNDAASQLAATDGEEGFSQEQVALAPDTTTDGEHSEAVAIASDTATVGDEGASHSEQVAVASEGASHSEQVAIASDTDEGASHSDQVVATDTTTDGEHSEQVAVTSDAATDDEGASQEQVALASDTGQEEASQRVPVEDAAPMETAKAEVGLTLDDQAGPPGQPATSAIFSGEDSLDFSAFAKQGAPAAVANQGMPAEFAQPPAEQLSPEAISGTPPSEAAPHPDVGSEDVGNAAPSRDPVVPHVDLAP